MAITISGENNNDKILAQDGVIDQISGINIVGLITASHIDVGSNINLGNAGIVTATTFVGNLTGNVNSTSPLLLQTGGSERFRITGNNELGIAGANYGSSGQVLTSGGSGNAVTWTTPTVTSIVNYADNKLVTATANANSLNAEAGLTWTGSVFQLTSSGGNQFPFNIRNDFTPNSQRCDFGYFANSTSNNALRLGSVNSNGGVTIQSTRMNDSAQKHNLILNPDGGDVIMGNTNAFNSNTSITPCFSIGSSAASRPGIVIRGSTTNKGDISFCDNSGTDSSDGVSEGLIRYDHATDHMEFHTADDERLRITSGGRIGINTSDPQINGKGLHIQGANVPNSHYDTYVGLIVENPEGRIQIVSNNDGNQASQLTLTNAPSSGDNLHWIVEHSAASASNSFHIGHKTSSGGYPGSVLDTGNFDVDFRILTNGVSQFTTTASFDSYTTAANAFQFRHDFTNVTLLWLSNTNTSHTKELLRLDSARAGSSSFFLANFTTGNLSDDQFLFRGDGNAYQDGGTTWSTPADYAEMFEWEDGNPDNEDRRGISVVLVGDKIRAATSSDDTSQIIGVISGNPAVTGDGAYTKWHLKYLLDDYNNYILDENNERKLNPDYDPTKTYIPREDRKEWSAVGMLGKLRVKVNQPVGASWIKLKNISDTVEQWLVR